MYANFNTRVLIRFEACAKFGQQWLVCTPLVIRFEPLNKTLMLLVTYMYIIIIKCAI